MSNIPQKLGMIFLFGIGFALLIAGMGTGAWLLVKLVSALRRLGMSPEERKKQAAAARHPFAGVSLRGKAVWLIRCLEQALEAGGLYGGREEPGGWYPLLRLLRQVDDLPEELVEGEWLDRVVNILPSVVLSCGPGADESSLPPEEQEQFAAACSLYRQAGPRMAYLAPLMELIYRLVRDYRDPPAGDPDGSLELLDQARQILEDYAIPLPPRAEGASILSAG